MPDKLTAKQEAFAQKYVECLNASEAYRSVCEVAKDTKPESVWRSASRMLSDVHVMSRVADLQQEHRERHFVTIDMLTAELDEARQLALRDEKGASAAVSATMGKAKLHGLLVEKSEQTATISTINKIELVAPDEPDSKD